MFTCPMCKKRVRGLARECPTCRTDLAILVDYLQDLDASLQAAETKTRAGQLGEAVRAYLEVLEVDPDNPTARHHVGEIVTAVRQFDAVAPGRQWLFRLHRQARWRRWREDVQDLTPTGCFTILAGVVLLTGMLFAGYGLGYSAAISGPAEPSATPIAPTTPIKLTPRERTEPRGPLPLGK